MNKKILISSLIISIVLTINAAGPTIWGHNGWDVDNSSSGIVTENKHPQEIASYRNGCPIKLHGELFTGGGLWYEIVSGGSGYDSKLWYKDRNDVWRQLSDDDGDGLNFHAVVYFPAGGIVEIAYGYYSYYDTYPYWSSIVASQVDPNKDIPYLIVDPDGSLRVEE